MTTPGDDFVRRVALAARSTGGSRPSTAMSLASSDLGDDEIGLVGNFIRGMDTTLVARMARSAGARTMLFSAEEKAQMDALNEDYSQVDWSSQQKDEPRSAVEKAFDVAATWLGNTGEAITGALHPVLTTFDWLMNGVKLPARLLSDSIDQGNDDEIDDAMRAKGYDPGSKASYLAFMWNQGNSQYHDLDPLRQQFGEDTVDLALEFFADPEGFQKRRLTDAAFDARAAKIMADPEWEQAADFVDRKHISPGRDVARVLLPESAEHGALFTTLSGTLDAAYTLALDPTLVVGKGLRLARAAEAATGAIHAAGLSRFGASRGLARVVDTATHGYFRGGIRDARDMAGIRAIFERDPATGKIKNQVGRHIERFINDANELRRLHAAGDDLGYAKLHAKLTRRDPMLMPFLEQLNGRRVMPPSRIENRGPAGIGETLPSPGPAISPYVRTNDVVGQADKTFAETITRAAENAGDRPVADGLIRDATGAGDWVVHGDPITTAEDFADYLASTTGLLKFAGGWAAQTNKIMPGRTSLRAAIGGKFREWRVGRQLADGGVVFDHAGNVGRLGKDMPVPEEAAALDELDAIPAELSAEQKGERTREILRSHWPTIQRARARHDRRVRRLATLLPTVTALDLHSGAHAEQVRRFARLYLSRTEGDYLAAMWTRGTAGERRQIARGMLEQTFHASGLSQTEQGQALWRRFRADQDELDRQMYGYDGTDVVQTDRGPVRMALHPSQLSQFVLLPSFRELQYAASKYNAASWTARNVGARFYSDTMDAAMTAIKMGWITTAAGGLRNALDEVAGIALRGEAGAQLRMRAAYTKATRRARARVRSDSKRYQKMVREHGQDYVDEWVGKQVVAAGGDAEKAKAAVLEARIKHRIPLALRGAADKANDVLFADVIGRYLSARGAIDDTTMDNLAELLAFQQAGMVNRIVNDTYYGDDMAGINDERALAQLARQGIASTGIRFRPNGWEKVELDGGLAHDAWAAKLHQMFGDPTAPGHVALKALWEHDAKTAQQEVLAYLDDPRMKWFVDNAERFQHQSREDYADRLIADVKLSVTGKGRSGWTAEQIDGTQKWLDAKAAARRDRDFEKLRLNTPRYEKLHQQAADELEAEYGVRTPESPEQEAFLDDAKRRIYAAGRKPAKHTRPISDAQIRAYLREVHGVEPRPGEFGNGQIDGALAEMLLAGEVPPRDFLSALPAHAKPRYVYQQQFVPIMPSGNLARLAGNWTEFLAKGYRKLVTDQVQAISRNPLLASKYDTARRATKSYEEHLVELGWDEGTAAQLAANIALRHAEQEVIKHIDNPQVASQFSVLSRNFWAFERAQEDWLRRWGRNLRDDPTIIRKVQLALHGGEAAGVLHQDDSGSLTFTYPGSGMVIQALNKVWNALPGTESLVKIPVVPDLSTKLEFVNPSLDNPLGFSATPVLSIPFRVMAATMGASHPLLVASMDKVLNGDLGAGREWYESVLPTPVNRIFSGAIRSDPGSQFGSAWMQSVMQMEAAGALDHLTGADPGERQKFFDTLSAQTRNNMIARALLGFFAPAAPGLPSNAVDVAALPKALTVEDFSEFPDPEAAYRAWLDDAEAQAALGRAPTEVDWTWHKMGLDSLRDEFRSVVAQVGYADAMTWWATNHPGELIIATGSTSKVGDASGAADAPATLAAAKWMQDNQQFLREYPGVGTYFLPEGNPGTPGGQFDQRAYNAQLEDGIRQKKELGEFLDDVIVKRGESIYYDTKDDYDQARANAERAGDTATLDQLDAEWAQHKALIYATNPLLAAKNASFAENTVYRQDQLRDLLRLMNDPRSARALGGQADGVQSLLDAYRQWYVGTDAIKGNRSNTATRQREELRQAYEQGIARVTDQHPGLKDLANGVFRIPG